MTIKIGMIGCGAWGWKYAPSILADKRASIEFCYRPSVDHIDKVKSCFPNIKISDSEDHVIKNSDAVIIASPPHTRNETILKCIYASVPMMIEKPVTLSYETYSNLLEKSKVPFLVNYIHLFSGAYEILRDSYLLNYKNQFVNIMSRGGSEGPFRSYSALWDYGPHDIALALGLGFRKPKVESCVKLETGSGESYSVRLNYSEGSHSFSVWNSHTPKRRFLSVSFDDWDAVYDDQETNKIKIGGQVYEFDTTPPLQRAVSNFIDYYDKAKMDWRWDKTITSDVMLCLEQIESFGG